MMASGAGDMRWQADSPVPTSNPKLTFWCVGVGGVKRGPFPQRVGKGGGLECLPCTPNNLATVIGHGVVLSGGKWPGGSGDEEEGQKALFK